MVKTKFARKNPGHVGPKTKKLVAAKRAKRDCATGKKTVSFSTKAGPVSFCASTKPKKRTGSNFVAMRKPRKKDYGKRVSRQLVDESGATLFMTDESDPWGLRS